MRRSLVSVRRSTTQLFRTKATASTSIIPENTSQNSDAGKRSDELEVRLKDRVNYSLQLYMKTVKSQEKFLADEQEIFDWGKRHLANMMGVDPEQLTQEIIDKEIKYLFPSGLFDEKALPVMKPPELIFPKFRKLEFDSQGRPKDPLFFTLRPKFYKILSEINKMTQNLVRNYDHKMRQNAHQDFEAAFTNSGVDPEKQLLLKGTVWKSKEGLYDELNEPISEEMHASFILALDYLTKLPNAHECRDFIMRFRKPLTAGSSSDVPTGRTLWNATVPEVQLDEEGRPFAVGKITIKRSTMEARVSAGSGKYTVNGVDLDEFRSIMAREVLLCPLIVTGLLGKVDIDAKSVDGPTGLSLVPRGVRHAVSLCLAALYPDTFERLRLTGLLTGDHRKKERSKVNQPGARAKWIWQKR